MIQGTACGLEVVVSRCCYLLFVNYQPAPANTGNVCLSRHPMFILGCVLVRATFVVSGAHHLMILLAMKAYFRGTPQDYFTSLKNNMHLNGAI